MGHLPASISATVGIKLKSARQSLGLSTREVASRISDRYSLTHATISNYEAGKTAPPLDVLSILASFYDRPLNWFLESGPTLTNVHYRNLKSKTKVSELRQYEALAQRWLEAYKRLEDWLQILPPTRRHDFSFEPRVSGREAAEAVRHHLKLEPEQPIASVTELLEQFGIRVIELKTDFQIDGMAALYGEEHAIVLNPRVANDRCRMNAAHELGHVLLDDCSRECGHDDSATEKRAYEFGSHLLISQSQLAEAFAGRSMVKLVKFKEKFGISLSAMIYRAQSTGILPEATAKWLWVEFAKRGWRKEEPGRVRPDRATRFEELLSGAIAQEHLTWSKAARLMRVPEADLHERMNIALGSSAEESEEGGDSPRNQSEVLPFRRN